MSERVWNADQIEKWDEESLRCGFKIGPVDRPSTLPAFWNEAQAEKWVEDGMPHVDQTGMDLLSPFPAVALLDGQFVGVIA